ncbi:MAG: Thiol:disulfide interchange protein DsbD [Fimbriimonadaceae bacterium]|nr:Thiol:disulfide interchange protein DsbD [Fimbriimonadaceae bacterium]
MRAVCLILALIAIPGSIDWRKDLEKSVAKAKREKKELALYFKTTWCKWCDKFDKTTLIDDAVVEAMGTRVAVKIDAERNRALVRKYAVACYPTILLMDANGTIRTRIEGYKTADELLPALR